MEKRERKEDTEGKEGPAPFLISVSIVFLQADAINILKVFNMFVKSRKLNARGTKILLRALKPLQRKNLVKK